MDKLKNKDIQNCPELIYYIHTSSDPYRTINQLGRVARPVHGFTTGKSHSFITTTLTHNYNLALQNLPAEGGKKLAYYPDSLNPVTMITSQFAHASLIHLTGNLLFFIAFAASVEVVIGASRFALLIILLSFGVSTAYTLTSIGGTTNIPTIGLSGVVMGIIGLFSYLMPTAKIRCALVLFVYIRVLVIPAWLIAIWFVGWDCYDLFIKNDHTGINLVSHVSGAFIGYLTGQLFLSDEKLSVAKYFS